MAMRSGRKTLLSSRKNCVNFEMKMHMKCTSEARPGRFASGTKSFILVTSTDSCPACKTLIKLDSNLVVLHLIRTVNRNESVNDITVLAETCTCFKDIMSIDMKEKS